MNFSDELIERIKQKESMVCLGLDPDPNHEDFPSHLIDPKKLDYETMEVFNKSLIDELSDKIVMIKPNLKFYEAYGVAKSLKKIIQYAQSKDLLVTLDSKGNDILTSMDKHYEGMFNYYKADAITVNAYMGEDVISPFKDFHKNGKGLFVLVKTSNKSSADFQDLFSIKLPKYKEIFAVEAKKINLGILKRNYLHMADLIKKWGKNFIGSSGYSSIGAVVGATFPEEMAAIRKNLPNVFFLIPGYGAQGGSLETITPGINEDGLGAIINSSRGIMYAWNKRFKGKMKEKEYLKAASKEVDVMNKEFLKFIKR